MTESFQKIYESKRSLRRELASRSIAEKLRMLDAMREREAVIRQATHRKSQDIHRRVGPK